jgi:NAD(P)-dependent dehydrogenase (short-subunit alcohol dehydrogenase family)
MEAMGRTGAAVQLDVGDISSLDGFIRRIQERLASQWDTPGFDILVNNAGIGGMFL